MNAQQPQPPVPPEASWPMEQLFAEARRLAVDIDDPRYWELLWVLQRRATTEVWQRAAALCESAEPSDRGFGANVLSRLRNADDKREHPKFWRRSVPLLLRRLVVEANAEILESVVAALGCLRAPRTIAPLTRFAHHPAVMVRWQLTGALAGSDDPLAVATLLEMMRDEDEVVRDWATFYVGIHPELDSPAVRAALLDRLNDEDAETRAEAIRGLVNRHDSRAVDALVQELMAHKLSETQDSTTLLEVATELADPRVSNALLTLKRESLPLQWREYYDQAVEKCRAP